MKHTRLAAVLLALACALAGGTPASADGPLTAEEERLYDLYVDFQFDPANELAQRVLAAHPKSLHAHKALFSIAYFDPRRDLEDLAATYRARATREPAEPLWQALALHGDVLLAQRLADGEERQRAYERLAIRADGLARSWPECAEIHALRARTRMLLGATRAAGEAVARAIDLDPENVLLRTASAASYLPAARLEANLAWLDRYARTHPGTPLARAIELEQTDRIDAEAERALRLEALLPEMRGTGHEDDLRLRLAQLDRHADEHLEAILARGYCNRYVEAVQLLAERARGKNEVWAFFTAEELRQENLRRAIAILRRAESRFVVIPGDLLAERARCHYQLKEYEEARQCVHALAAQGRHEARRVADYQSLIGDCHYAEGEYAEARRIYDRALEHNAAFPFPSRLRHVECLVRAYPLLAVAQGSTIFLLLLAVFLSVAITVARLRHARRYFRLAALPALCVTGFELALLLRTTGEAGTWALMVAVVGFLKNFFLLVAGMVLAARGGVRPFALLRGLAARLRRGSGPARPWARAAIGCVAAGFAAWALLLGLTIGLVRAVNPQVSEAIQVAKPIESATERRETQQVMADPVAQATLLGVAAALEELLFRWFLLGLFQSYLRRYRWSAAGAIGLTALLWGIGHLGGVDPWWFRMVQTTAAGCILGWLRWRRGVELSFLVHAVYNWTQMILAWGVA